MGSGKSGRIFLKNLPQEVKDEFRSLKHMGPQILSEIIGSRRLPCIIIHPIHSLEKLDDGSGISVNDIVLPLSIIELVEPTDLLV